MSAVNDHVQAMADKLVIEVATSCTQAEKSAGQELFLGMCSMQYGLAMPPNYKVTVYAEYLRRRFGDLCHQQLVKKGQWAKPLFLAVRLGTYR